VKITNKREKKALTRRRRLIAFSLLLLLLMVVNVGGSIHALSFTVFGTKYSSRDGVRVRLLVLYLLILRGPFDGHFRRAALLFIQSGLALIRCWVTGPKSLLYARRPFFFFLFHQLLPSSINKTRKRPFSSSTLKTHRNQCEIPAVVCCHPRRSGIIRMYTAAAAAASAHRPSAISDY